MRCAISESPTPALAEPSLRWGLPVVTGDAQLDPHLALTFDDWLAGTGSMLIEAPRGFGKSTQLAAWLQSQSSSTAAVWISGSNFVGTWEAARTVLLHALVHLGLVPQGIDPDDAGAVYLALKALDQPVIVVHEDFDKLLPTVPLSSVERFTRDFPSLRNIYTSAGVMGEPDLTADHDRVVVTHRELSWTRDFAASVLGSHLSGSRAAHRLDDVIDATGGRAVAILEYYRSPSRGSRSRDSVAEFHARWLRERATMADPSGRGAVLLLDLAQFIEVPLTLLAELGHPDAGSLVNGLVREGLVTVSRSPYGGASVLSVPESTRAALLGRSNEMLGAVLRDFHLRAAAAFENQQSFPLAAYHLARAGSHAQAMRHLARPISSEDQGAGIRVARAAFLEIPLDLLATKPGLLAMRIITAHAVPVESIHTRGDAELRLLSMSDEAIAALSLRTRAAIATATVAALVGRNRAAEAVVRGRAVAGDLDGLGWDDVRSLGRVPGLLWTVLAEAELVNCNAQRALALSTAASEWNTEIGHPIAILRAVSVRAAANAMEGDLDRARSYIVEAEAAIAFHQLAPSSRPLTLAIAQFFLALADLDASAMSAVAKVARTHSPGEAPWSGMGAAAEAYAHLFAGRVMDSFASSRLVLRAAESRATPLIVRHMILCAHSDALLASGRPGEVLALLEAVVEPVGHPFCYASRKAGAALAMGDAARAVRLTEECLELGSAHAGSPLAGALIRRAAAHESLQMPAAADASFSGGMALLTQNPCAFAFLNLTPAVLVPLWVRLGTADPMLLLKTVALADRWLQIRASFPTTDTPVHLPPEKLSPRELEVLEGLQHERTYKQIGDGLFLSENTVKTHVRRIYKKLRAASRTEAVDASLKLGLLGKRRHD